MTQATKITFDLGQDKYGRKLQLLRTRDSAGTITWSLERAASNQLDERARVDEIPEDVMRKIVNTVSGPGHWA